MTDIVTPEFLNELRFLYPQAAPAKYIDRGWYLAAAVAFSSSNYPEALPDTSDEDRRLLVRKMREAIFKSGLLSGYPKVIHALISLCKATPEELRDTESLRCRMKATPLDRLGSREEVAAAGQAYFDLQYGNMAGEIQPMLRSIYPDLEQFTIALGYGYVYAFLEVISSKERSFAIISALIANDTPSQVEWQLTGAIRNGATIVEVRGVREIALRMAMKAGVLKHEVPNI
ncbi:hypothetical protein BDR07DRAFT_1484015 [Suillus spraguei]|nr:hypothetical protein BDR07DRAFT_1484015 [Suillus spraguei]